MKRLALCFLVVWTAGAVIMARGRPVMDDAPVAAAAAAPDAQAVLSKYCLTCHNGRVHAGNLNLEGFAFLMRTAFLEGDGRHTRIFSRFAPTVVAQTLKKMSPEAQAFAASLRP